MENLSPDDKIGHFVIVNIKFDIENANERSLLFKEIYTPIFEKDKCLDSSEQSIFQLMDTMRKNDKGGLNTYRYNEKMHARMKTKILLLSMLIILIF